MNMMMMDAGPMSGVSGTFAATENYDDPFGVMVGQAPLILRCKIVLLGDATVGKTSIAQIFQGGLNNFPKNYNMTMGLDFLVKKVPVPDTNVVVEIYIVDCGGFATNEAENLLSRPHWENANAFMFVYDVSNPETFQNLDHWYRQVKEARGELAVTGVVVANKTDLADRSGIVSDGDGKSFSEARGLEFLTACAAQGDVDKPFELVAFDFCNKYSDRKAQLEAGV
mmetsp:Transcript_50090/g.117049  ORF Transcript_50090/g.117049 Transcript_50090/m.117049 type:complete len:225 (-) Transcript_50090:44-718(-)